MKIGDKVWVLCEVASTDECYTSFRHGSTHFRAKPGDYKPFEPEAFQLRKPNAIFTMQGHVRKGTYGVAKYNGNLWHFESVDGKFKRWCEGQHIKLLDEDNIELPVKQSPKDDEHCIGNVCDMFEPTGIACPHDSCDIETGIRNAVVKQSTTIEEQPPSDSDYRDATPEDGLRAMQGENVRARFRDDESEEWISKDQVLDRYQPAKQYKWIDGDGCSRKYCQVYDPKKPEPKSGLQLLFGSDTVEPGDLFHSSRDGKFHRCNFTMGMKVCDAVLRGEQQRETWTFYRPKMGQA
jgi:hypothetical protein